MTQCSPFFSTNCQQLETAGVGMGLGFGCRGREAVVVLVEGCGVGEDGKWPLWRDRT